MVEGPHFLADPDGLDGLAVYTCAGGETLVDQNQIEPVQLGRPVVDALDTGHDDRVVGVPAFEATFANGLLLCEFCGSMITGERIRRKLKDGGVRLHTYDRCANNRPADDHPIVRWREADLEEAVVAELESLRMPTVETAEWFRGTLDRAFGRLRGDQGQQKRILGRKKVEVEKQSERLLSLYLDGHLDAGTYQDRSAALQGQVRELENGLSACGDFDPACRDLAVKVFDFTQKAAEVWRGSKMAGTQRILRAESLNRTLNDVSLCLEKRKPFSLLAERLPVRTSRGDWI